MTQNADGMKGLFQLTVVSAALLCSLGHLHTVHYQYAVRFLYQENCSNCLDVCRLRASQCAKLQFHYFNVAVHSIALNCTAREMLLLLELQQTEREDGDSVYLEACIDGMDKYHFWSYLACSTVTEGGGSEVAFIGCKPNEILSPVGSRTTVVPTWVPVVLTILAVGVIIAVLTTCVTAYQYYRYRTGRTNYAQARNPVQYEQFDGSQAQSWLSRLKQWVMDRGLVEHNWNTPTPRTAPMTYERQRPRGSSMRSEQHKET